MRNKMNVLVLAVLLFAMAFSLGSFCSDDVLPPRSPTTIPQPTLIYPIVNSTNQSITPYFAWECENPYLSLDLTYELFLNRGDNTGDTFTVTTDEKFFQYTDELSSETLYRWSVTAIANGKRTASPFQYFTTGTGYNNPPLSPKLIVPYEYGYYPLDVTFTWTCLDPDGDALSYDVWLAEYGSALELVSEGQSATEYQSPSLEFDTDYKWQVVAHDDESESAPSRLTRFFTKEENDPPNFPQAMHPLPGAISVPREVTLRWSCSDPDGDPLVYDVLFGSNGTYNTISQGSADTFITVQGLDYGTTYGWKVKAFDTAGNETSRNYYWEFTTEYDPGSVEGVYAELLVHRSQYFNGIELTRIDYISARFDSVYSPDGPIKPLQPAAVCCGQPVPGCVYDLVWQPSWNRYYFNNPYAGYFLAPGAEYYFEITEGGGVPSLVTDPVLYLECRPYITSPEAYSYVTLEGLEVVWANYDLYPDCDRPVTIRILDLNASWTDVFITTANDGSYTFTAGDLAGLSPSAYQLQIVLIVDSRENIVATGYDPRSWIETSTWATQIVYRNP
jgi:hypothetical protein